MDKEVSRKLFHLAGIRTVPTITLRRHDYLKDAKACEARILKEFSFPLFVKPANAGSSVGVHKVKSAGQLALALQDAFQFDLKVLIEKGVDARELECSVLGNDEPRASVVGEIIPHHEFYSYEAKYLDENGSSFAIPAKDLPEKVSRQIQEWAALAFQTLQCRGMARVDFFLDRQTGELYLNEINTIPGFTKISMYPKMWEASGLGYAALLDELIRLALENFEQRKSLKTTYDPK
jgi:D-alanine-D-alanine ligase